MTASRPRSTIAIIGAAALAAGCTLTTSARRSASAESAVRAAERRRFEAMIVADIQALDTLLATDLTYTHTTGKVDTKGSLMEDLLTGRLDYDSIVPADVRVRVYGRTAAVIGTARMQVRASGEVRRLGVRFTEVYVDSSGRWQLVAWQSTPLPDP